MSRLATPLALLSLAFCVAPARAADPAPAPDAKAAFALMKGLAGDWEGTTPHGKSLVRYQVVSRGSVVMETIDPNTDHEMISMYHLDGDTLRMTHYCAAGNQPRMKLDTSKSTAATLVFAFDGGTNLDPATSPHVHDGSISLLGPDAMESNWSFHVGGKPVGEHPFKLTRKPAAK